MAYYRCGPTAIGSRSSWAPASSPEACPFPRPLSGHFDRIFNAFERSNAFQYVRAASTSASGDGEVLAEERLVGHGDVVVNRKMSSSFERADCALAAQTPLSEDEDFYREKILYSQARQLFPLQEDLADWINKTIGITYLNGENFLDVLDNGAELCQLAAVIHDKAREALDSGLIVGPVPQIRGRCWQRAARRSFFSRDNTENFITFCRELGVHENLLFESDDLVLHNQPRQVILCLLEVARLATRFDLEPPGLVQLEKEIALEERDSGLDSCMSGPWQFSQRDPPAPHKPAIEPPDPTTPDQNDSQISAADNTDAESTKSEETVASTDSDVPLKPTNELDKRVQLVTRLMERGCSCGAGRCSRLLKVKKVGEGRYNIAGRNVFIRLLKGRHMMVRVGGGWDTLEHFLSRHEPCQVRLVAGSARRLTLTAAPTPPHASPTGTASPTDTSPAISGKTSPGGKTSPAVNGKISPAVSGKLSPASGKLSPSASGKLSPAASGKLSPAASGKLSPAASGKISPAASGKLSPVASGKLSPAASGKISPVANGKLSPAAIGKLSPAGSGKTSPAGSFRTSTSARSRASLTLPLQPTPPRKQSAPSLSTPSTPGRAVRTPPHEYRKSLTSASLVTAPKKSRSMSLALPAKFCGADRLNQAAAGKGRSASAAGTPTEPWARKTRSQSLASTPLAGCRQTRSMSLATSQAPAPRAPARSASVTVAGALTQAAIEESIRRSLAASIADDHCAKKPFLHIKAKYRSPPPREVPPR